MRAAIPLRVAVAAIAVMMTATTAGSVKLPISRAAAMEAERLVMAAIEKLEATYAGLKGHLDRSPEVRAQIISRLPADFPSALSRSLSYPDNQRQLGRLGISSEHFLDAIRSDVPPTPPRFDIDRQKILWGSGVAAGTAAGFVCGRYLCIDKDPTARLLESLSEERAGATLSTKP